MERPAVKHAIAVVPVAALLVVVSTAEAAAVPSFTATSGADQTVALDAPASACDFGPRLTLSRPWSTRSPPP